jgi:hypothetical protein
MLTGCLLPTTSWTFFLKSGIFLFSSSNICFFEEERVERMEEPSCRYLFGRVLEIHEKLENGRGASRTRPVV